MIVDSHGTVMELLELYREIEAITKPLCLSGEGCGMMASRKYHCCERQYCDMAAKFARDGYGIELQPTSHPTIPFMGPSGCIVPLHLRPICTIHACARSWTDKTGDNPVYTDLRNRILEAERLAGRRVI